MNKRQLTILSSCHRHALPGSRSYSLMMRYLGFVGLCLWGLWCRADESGPAENPVDKKVFVYEETKRAELVERGAGLYAEKCAACHGDKGQGVEDAYSTPLTGDRSIQELASVIHHTMPEGEPEKCQDEDALAVALYAFDAFYSELAQARNTPPRAAFARLTGEQYRQSLTDIYTHFRNRNELKEERGLAGIYFNHAGWREGKKAFERVDAQIDFDYGDNSPGEGIEKERFGIYWNGGLLVPESGRYEIIARGLGSFKVKFIDTETPLFDNHVQSGDVAEYKANLDLLGGRIYPLQLEFIKRERKTGNVAANFELAWRTPGGIEQIIPTRHLIPGWFDRSFAPQTPLPPDDRSAGYERGNTISREWDAATTQGAIEFANLVVSDLWPHYRKERSKKEDAPKGRDLLKAFAYELVDVALRRPAGDETRKVYVDSQLAEVSDDEEALRRIVVLTLKSPRFLYPALPDDSTEDWKQATRLALTLWDSIPSKQLWQRAEQGNLKTEQQVREAASQMMNDPRTKAKIRGALHHWLNLTHMKELSKDEKLYPGFDAALASDLKTSLDLFLETIVESDASDFRQLLQADWSYSSPLMEKFYGESWKPTGEDADGAFSRTASDGKVRVGVLTHPLLASTLAYNDHTSPIHRGVFLTRHVLGRVLKTPQAAFSPLSPDLHADLTTRERVELQTSPAMCQSCHVTINALGFTLENFDAVGRWREAERNKSINVTGYYVDRQGAEQRFQGARELADYLVSSDDAQSAFINRLFLHFVKQPVGAYGSTKLDELKQKFCDSGYHIRNLIIEIAVVAAKGPMPPQAT